MSESHSPENAEHLHEFGNVATIVHVEREIQQRFIHEPTIHQYLQNGKVHRQRSKRPVGQFELFLDLVMVGVVHQLADLASETETGLAIVRFVLTFWGAWSIWADYRNYINISSMDDFLQRLYTFCMMAILIGYSANSTGVEIEHGRFVENKETHASMRGAVGFLLVAKCIRFVLHVFYAFYLPDFFLDQMINATWMLVACGLYLGSLFAPHIITQTIIFGAAGVTENCQIFFSVVMNRTLLKFQTRVCGNKRLSWFERVLKEAKIACVNIEHAVERNTGFYTIVLGESVTNLLYQVAKFEHSVGVSQYYGRAFCVLLVSFNMNWLYFTDDRSVMKVHPIRRHWFMSFFYQILHWPLTAGLIIASASVAQLVHPNTPAEAHSQAARYYWGGGMAVAIFCLTVLDLLPRWDYWSWDRLLAQGSRTFFRLGAVAICVTVPLADRTTLTNIGFVGIYAGVSAFLVVEELLGKMLIMRCSQRRVDRGDPRAFAHEHQPNAAPGNGAQLRECKGSYLRPVTQFLQKRGPDSQRNDEEAQTQTATTFYLGNDASSQADSGSRTETPSSGRDSTSDANSTANVKTRSRGESSRGESSGYMRKEGRIERPDSVSSVSSAESVSERRSADATSTRGQALGN